MASAARKSASQKIGKAKHAPKSLLPKVLNKSRGRKQRGVISESHVNEARKAGKKERGAKITPIIFPKIFLHPDALPRIKLLPNVQNNAYKESLSFPFWPL